jgi:ketosteroid isomerase-like protein
LQCYKDAIQNLSTEGTFELFVEDSEVFEQGGVEGTYTHYVEHHLGPELGYFESFTFSDYQVNVELAGDYAFTVETYLYNIVINAHDEKPRRVIDKKGLATSILIRTETGWRIKHNHSSSRAVKKTK